MIYAQPGQANSKVTFKKRYENFIGGAWIPPVKGQYFEILHLLQARFIVRYQDQRQKILSLHLVLLMLQKINGEKLQRLNEPIY